jgi:hypothetical protein
VDYPIILLRPVSGGMMSAFYFYGSRPEPYYGPGIYYRAGFTAAAQVGTVDQVAASFDWRSYEPTPNNAAGFGMRIKNDAGDTVFDSSLNYMEIQDVFNPVLAAPSWGSYPYIDYAHAATDPFYWLLTYSRAYITSVSGGSFRRQQLRVGIQKLSSNSVRVGWFVEQTDDRWHSIALNPGQQFPIIYNNPAKLLVVT